MNREVVVTAVNMIDHLAPVPAGLAAGLRRADDFIRMAVTAAHGALFGLDQLEPERTGIFLGTAYGPLETNFESLASLIDDGEGHISPTLFSHSVFNSAAGYVGRLLNLQGPALTITDYGWPFLAALEEGRVAVASGRVARAVVLGVETYSELLADAYCRAHGVVAVPWRKAAVAWVLAAAETQVGVRLEEVTVCGATSDPADCLTRLGEVWGGLPSSHDPLHPLSHALVMTEVMAASDQVVSGPLAWELTSPFGTAIIRLKVAPQD
ncbi:MAG: hypothetical protein KJ950_00620 [Proteobacteria bacterium]|nr:hypothetical protein [Pseudomonadota bacterium]MBU1685856.1 hypothetical protein [Pseudomonadota bacterium]